MLPFPAGLTAAILGLEELWGFVVKALYFRGFGYTLHPTARGFLASPLTYQKEWQLFPGSAIPFAVDRVFLTSVMNSVGEQNPPAVIMGCLQ